MQKFLGVIVLVLGVWFLLKALFSGWILFLLIAAALAVAAGSNTIGKWGYTLAGVFALLALPGLVFKTIGVAFALIYKLAPVLLLLLGIYMLVKPSTSRFR